MFDQLKIGVGISGSFCSMTKLLEVLHWLKETNADLYLILTPEVATMDTRFFPCAVLKEKLLAFTPHPLITTIQEAELFGPKEPLDLMLLMPASANTLSKIAHGICDNAVIMATKATLRNGKPIVVSFYTNDALGNSGVNILRLFNTKDFYFVPFGQDDPQRKPKSMTSDHRLVLPTIQKALEGQQIQPVVVTFDEH